MYKTLIKLVKKLATLTNIDKSYSVFVYATYMRVYIRVRTLICVRVYTRIILIQIIIYNVSVV